MSNPQQISEGKFTLADGPTQTAARQRISGARTFKAQIRKVELELPQLDL